MSGQTVFDEVGRTDGRPATNLEGRFHFLNRAAGPVFDRIRALLEDWFQRYPADAQAELRSRLRGSNKAFGGAFWELYQHEALTRMGFEVDLHPTVPGTSQRPDFLVYRAGFKDRGFYLEATLTGASALEEAAAMRLGAIYDLINTVHTPDFFLDVEVERQGKAAPPTRRLRRDLVEWLATVAPDSLIDESGRHRLDHHVELVWRLDDWRLVFRPIAKSVGARGKPGRAIGMHSTGARFVDSRGPLRAAIHEKASRYGKPDRPYVLAVLIEDAFVDEEDLIESLFGSIAYRIPFTHDGPGQPKPFRKRDGSWMSGGGPQYRRLSAVMTAVNLVPWSVPRTAPVMWLNPWATSLLPERLPWRTVRADMATNEFAEDPALITPADLLDLPAEWPGPEDPFAQK